MERRLDAMSADDGNRVDERSRDREQIQGRPRYGVPLLVTLGIMMVMMGAIVSYRSHFMTESIDASSAANLIHRVLSRKTTGGARRSILDKDEQTKDADRIAASSSLSSSEDTLPEITQMGVALNPDGEFGSQVNEEQDEESEIKQLRERLVPRDLDIGPHGGPTRQFAHLHHMKTGGTSLNKAIKCALSRAQSTHNQVHVPYFSLSECKFKRFQQCMAGNDIPCKNGIDSALVMQFCAPLFAVNHFDWLDADLITMIRHPVDRVWSMYRFQTKSCYKCFSLLETFQRIENGTTSEICGACETVCMTQLSNHLVRNLLTTDPDKLDVPMTDEEMLEEAIWNLKNRVTLVGVTDQLNATWAMLGQVFPWLNSTVEGTTETCDLPHANSSPKNNRCGADGKHLDLPSVPDEETKAMILKHNQLDLRLFEEAQRWFELEKRALGLADE